MTKKREGWSAFLFLLPNFLGFLVFLLGPLVVSLIMAFTNWDLRKTVVFRFVGLRNFTDLLTSNNFWVYLINTIYLMLGIPLGIAGSLILALLLNDAIQENSWLFRFIHAALMLLCALVIAGALAAWGGSAGHVAAAMVLIAACIYALAVFSGIVVYRTIYYLPSFTSGVAMFILWKALYNPETGPINAVINWFLNGSWGGFNNMLAWFHIAALRRPGWLESIRNLFALNPSHPGFDPHLWGLGAREAIIIMGIVTGIGGGNMLLYLAGLTGIPQELYEAADIDGAGRWQRFWAVTWPQLAPTTFFIVVMSLIGGLQGGFDVAKVMTKGGPAGTTTTLSYYIYEKAFREFRFGYASAVSWMLFLLVFIVTALNWKFGNRQLNE